MEITRKFLDSLLSEAGQNERRRQNYDLRTSKDDSSQRMLNAMMPDTVVPIHRHRMSSETVICLEGRFDEIFFEETEGMFGPQLSESGRIHVCPASGTPGCVIPKDVWHTVEILEPTVIFEAKDQPYGADGSESWKG